MIPCIMSYSKGVDSAWGRYPSIYSWLSGEDNQGLRSKSLNLLSSIIDHDDSGNWEILGEHLHRGENLDKLFFKLKQ